MKTVRIEKELGAIPTKSEMEVVDILVLNNIPKRLVRFLAPNRTKGSKTPDLLMDGAFWEIKTIEKLGKYTIEHAGRVGVKQAHNLVFDLRKLSITLEKKAVATIKKNFSMTKDWRGLIIIIRPNEKCLTFRK